jgi:hypothetical protein
VWCAGLSKTRRSPSVDHDHFVLPVSGSQTRTVEGAIARTLSSDNLDEADEDEASAPAAPTLPIEAVGSPSRRAELQAQNSDLVLAYKLSASFALAQSIQIDQFEQARNRYHLSVFIYKRSNLPGQARDKHRENSQKSTVFLQAVADLVEKNQSVPVRKTMLNLPPTQTTHTMTQMIHSICFHRT